MNDSSHGCLVVKDNEHEEVMIDGMRQKMRNEEDDHEENG